MLKGMLKILIVGLLKYSAQLLMACLGAQLFQIRKVIGIYVGGSPVPGQRECIKILQRLERKVNPCEIFEDIRGLIAFDTFFYNRIYDKLFSEPIVQRFCLYGRVMAGGVLTKKEKKEIAKINEVPKEFRGSVGKLPVIIYDLIYIAINEFKDKDKFQVNVGISVQHDVFQQSISNIISKLLCVSRVQTLEDLADYLQFKLIFMDLII